MKVAAVCFFFDTITEDMLKVRLSEEYEIFDKFFVVEATRTHTGVEKDLKYDPKAFLPWLDKIEYVVVPDDQFVPGFEGHQKTPFRNEWRQRSWPLRSGMLEGYEFMSVADTDEMISKNNKEILIDFLKEMKRIEYSHGVLGYDCRRYFIDLSWTPSWEKGCMLNISNDFFRQRLLQEESLSSYGLGPGYRQLHLKHPSLPKLPSKRGANRYASKMGWHFAAVGNAQTLLHKHKNCIHARQYRRSDFDLVKIQKMLINLPNQKEITHFPRETNVLDYPKFILQNWKHYRKYTYTEFIKT